MSGAEKTRRPEDASSRKGPGTNPGPDPRREAPCWDLAEQRRQVLEAGRARLAPLARWWASLGPAERTAIPDRGEPTSDCERLAPRTPRLAGFAGLRSAELCPWRGLPIRLEQRIRGSVGRDDPGEGGSHLPLAQPRDAGAGLPARRSGDGVRGARAGVPVLRRVVSPGDRKQYEDGGAYEGDETRQLALDLGFTPVVPPLKTRREPWEYDRQLYKRRNEIERLFRRLKGFRCIFSRFEKLDALFLGFVHFALIYDAVR